MMKLESITQFNTERGQETLHPLISILDQSNSHHIPTRLYHSELYVIFLKDVKCEELQYGRNQYDYQEETLIFIAPGQIFGVDKQEKMIQPKGWALAFHPDLIQGTSLGKNIADYGFFAYAVKEALHISSREKQMILEGFKKIQHELENNIDKHSKTLIVSNIELLLNYCVRFYDRQFITRELLHKDVLTRFERLLNSYFQSDKPQTIGLPTVGYFAKQLNLSANYFGDLIKKETGKSAQEYIQNKVIAIAKERVFDLSKSISQVAYEMGFKYPQHFARFFKQKTGYAPNEYKQLN